MVHSTTDKTPQQKWCFTCKTSNCSKMYNSNHSSTSKRIKTELDNAPTTQTSDERHASFHHVYIYVPMYKHVCINMSPIFWTNQWSIQRKSSFHLASFLFWVTDIFRHEATRHCASASRTGIWWWKEGTQMLLWRSSNRLAYISLPPTKRVTSLFRRHFSSENMPSSPICQIKGWCWCGPFLSLL